MDPGRAGDSQPELVKEVWLNALTPAPPNVSLICQTPRGPAPRALHFYQCCPIVQAKIVAPALYVSRAEDVGKARVDPLLVPSQRLRLGVQNLSIRILLLQHFPCPLLASPPLRVLRQATDRCAPIGKPDWPRLRWQNQNPPSQAFFQLPLPSLREAKPCVAQELRCRPAGPCLATPGHGGGQGLGGCAQLMSFSGCEDGVNLAVNGHPSI